MNDDFVRNLQVDWQSQEYDVSNVLHRLRRARWMPHLVLGWEIVSCAVALSVGLWFAWVAGHAEEHKLLFALSAAVLLIAAPALCVACVIVRRHSLAWDAETPETLLAVGLRRIESSLSALRIGRWHLAIIALFVTTLWALEASGLIHAIDFVILYTAVCAVVSAVAWLWMRWREKRLRREQAALARLLAAMKVDA